MHERVAVFVAGHIYVHEHGRPACLPVTHYRDGYETHQFWRVCARRALHACAHYSAPLPFPHRHETHQFWRIFPDPPQLELAPVTNNYDKYANAYIDVSTQSCVTPSNAWERKIPKSLYSVRPRLPLIGTDCDGVPLMIAPFIKRMPGPSPST